MKEDGEDASRTSNGKAFHSKGARFEKEIEPERAAEIDRLAERRATSTCSIPVRCYRQPANQNRRTNFNMATSNHCCKLLNPTVFHVRDEHFLQQGLNTVKAASSCGTADSSTPHCYSIGGREMNATC